MDEVAVLHPNIVWGNSCPLNLRWEKYGIQLFYNRPTDKEREGEVRQLEWLFGSVWREFNTGYGVHSKSSLSASAWFDDSADTAVEIDVVYLHWPSKQLHDQTRYQLKNNRTWNVGRE